jgi:GntR family transcriptional regulator
MSDKWVSNSADYTARQPTGASDAWTQEAAARGRTGSQVLREVLEIAPTSLVCHGLAISADSTVVARRRTVLLDGEPVELADSYYPVVIAQGTQIAQSTKIRGGSPTLLAALGHPIKRVREEVSARPPTGQTRSRRRNGANKKGKNPRRSSESTGRLRSCSRQVH